MRRRCVVRGCCPSSAPQRTCHRFPDDSRYKTLWKEKCGAPIRNLISAGVCSDHFVEDDYFVEEDMGMSSQDEFRSSASLIRRLKASAVPSRNLPNLESMLNINSECDIFESGSEQIENNLENEDSDMLTHMKRICRKGTCIDDRPSSKVPGNQATSGYLNSNKEIEVHKQIGIAEDQKTVSDTLRDNVAKGEKRSADFEPETITSDSLKHPKHTHSLRAVRIKKKYSESIFEDDTSTEVSDTSWFPETEKPSQKSFSAEEHFEELSFDDKMDKMLSCGKKPSRKTPAVRTIVNEATKHPLDCVMPGCKPRSDRTAPKRRYHCFPADQKYREIWKKMCGVVDENLRNARVCSRHFIEKDYISNEFTASEFVRDLRKELLSHPQNKIKYLKADAVPSRYLTSWRKRTSSNPEHVVKTRAEEIPDVVTPSREPTVHSTSNSAVPSQGALETASSENHVLKGTRSRRKKNGAETSYLAARGSSCFVSTCTVRPPRTLPNNRPVFHRFPSDPKAKAIWLEKCKNLDSQRKEMRVCHRHFRDSDFIRDFQSELLPDSANRKKRLKKGAVPSLNLPDEFQYKKDQDGETEYEDQRLLKKYDEKRLLKEYVDKQIKRTAARIIIKEWNERPEDFLQHQNSKEDFTYFNESDRETISVRKSKFDKLKTEVAEMKKQYISMQSLASERAYGTKMYAKEEFARRLIGRFSMAQIGILWDPQRSCFWTAKEDGLFAAAVDSRSREGYFFLRNELCIPMPNLTTLKKWYRVTCRTCITSKPSGKDCVNCRTNVNAKNTNEESENGERFIRSVSKIDSALAEALKDVKQGFVPKWQHVVLPLEESLQGLSRTAKKRCWKKRTKKPSTPGECLNLND